MKLKVCPRCKKPFLPLQDVCPSCPDVPEWNQESAANAGCLAAMIVLPLLGVLAFWLFFFLGSALH